MLTAKVKAKELQYILQLGVSMIMQPSKSDSLVFLNRICRLGKIAELNPSVLSGTLVLSFIVSSIPLIS
jgi:hypothetical protein